MVSNTKYDVIIVGAGMGGLSAGTFLAREGKRALILEKHDKPGGYVTSFTRRGYTFDSSIFHLTDMGENQTISQFIRFWGGKIRSRKVRYKFRYFIGDREYLIDGKNVEKDLTFDRMYTVGPHLLLFQTLLTATFYSSPKIHRLIT